MQIILVMSTEPSVALIENGAEKNEEKNIEQERMEIEEHHIISSSSKPLLKDVNIDESEEEKNNPLNKRPLASLPTNTQNNAEIQLEGM